MVLNNFVEYILSYVEFSRCSNSVPVFLFAMWLTVKSIQTLEQTEAQTIWHLFLQIGKVQTTDYKHHHSSIQRNNYHSLDLVQAMNNYLDWQF